MYENETFCVLRFWKARKKEEDRDDGDVQHKDKAKKRPSITPRSRETPWCTFVQGILLVGGIMEDMSCCRRIGQSTRLEGSYYRGSWLLA